MQYQQDLSFACEDKIRANLEKKSKSRDHSST
jgi:hypothetical protein